MKFEHFFEEPKLEMSVRRRVGTMVNQYGEQLSKKSLLLSRLWQQLVERKDQDSIDRLLRLCHQVSQSGSAFGYQLVSKKAADFEAALMQWNKDGAKADQIDRLEPVKAALDAVMRTAQVQEDTDANPDYDSMSQDRKVFVVEEDQAMAGWLKEVLESHYYSVTLFSDLSEANEVLAVERPAVILLDVQIPDTSNEKFETAIRYCREHRTAVVVLSHSRDFHSRLRAVRAGAQQYLCKPVHQSTLLACLQEVLQERPPTPYRVMIVDPDTETTDRYRAALREVDVDVQTVAQPEASLELLNEFQPELILIELNLPGCDGVELGQVIRQQVKHANIPILFAVSDDESAQRLQDIRAAGDDYLSKPIEADALCNNVVLRLKRARLVNEYVSEILEEMSFKEHHDALTGLPNRKQLENRLELALRNVREGVRNHLALFLMDVDNFQHVNDAYGHQCGDELLIDLAKRLESALPHNAIISRPGGDEFAILFKNLGAPGQVDHYAERLLQLCELPFIINDDELKLSFSIGITSYDQGQGPMDGKALFKQADTALFRAKASGKNDYVFFETKMESELVARVAMTSDIRKGLQQEQFFIVLQPQVLLSNATLFGAEVLLRWNHPTRGLVSPGEFIPVAEAHGLIDQLGEFVMRSTVKQIAQWQRTYGKIIPLAVNVSPRQFAREDFVEQVSSLLKEYGVHGRWLELEITESALAHDIDTAVEKLMALRDLGVRMAVDDFGTGFSNMASLKRYPVDLLKIDRSFIRDLPSDGDNLAIVSAIIEMAKSLGLKLLAEGVESKEQMQIMRHKQCDLVQGFYVARPMDVAQFESQYLKQA